VYFLYVSKKNNFSIMILYEIHRKVNCFALSLEDLPLSIKILAPGYKKHQIGTYLTGLDWARYAGRERADGVKGGPEYKQPSGSYQVCCRPKSKNLRLWLYAGGKRATFIHRDNIFYHSHKYR
jgi:hypothetical protein